MYASFIFIGYVFASRRDDARRFLIGTMDAYNEVAVSKMEIATFQINKAFYIEKESQGCDSFFVR